MFKIVIENRENEKCFEHLAFFAFDASWDRSLVFVVPPVPAGRSDTLRTILLCKKRTWPLSWMKGALEAFRCIHVVLMMMLVPNAA